MSDSRAIIGKQQQAATRVDADQPIGTLIGCCRRFELKGREAVNRSLLPAAHQTRTDQISISIFLTTARCCCAPCRSPLPYTARLALVAAVVGTSELPACGQVVVLVANSQLVCGIDICAYLGEGSVRRRPWERIRKVLHHCLSAWLHTLPVDSIYTPVHTPQYSCHT